MDNVCYVITNIEQKPNGVQYVLGLSNINEAVRNLFFFFVK